MYVPRLFVKQALAATVLLSGLGCLSGGYVSDGGIQYPRTRTVNVVEDYHGTKVADPYRWLEDDNSDETAAWVEAQNEVTFDYLESIPQREAIKNRLTELWNHEKFGLPSKVGDHYFFSRNDGLQNQDVIYTMDSLDGEPKVLIDPNTLSEDGTVALASRAISDDGKFMAYGLSTSGSDWREFKVRNVETGLDVHDHLKWIKFSGTSWTKDSQGFFYSRYDEPKTEEAMTGTNYFQKLYYHRVGTPQSADPLIYERTDHKDWGFGGSVSEDGRFLIITVSLGTETRNMVFYIELGLSGGQVVELIDRFEAEYSFIGNEGSVFWFQTDLDAPRGRVIAIDTKNPDRAHWKEIIPQAPETLSYVNIVNDTFVCSYLKDAHTQVKMFRLDGSFLREVEFPGIGSASGFGGKRSDQETFYSFTSYTTPPTIYRYDMETGESSVFRKPQIDFVAEDYVTKQVFYRSKDGTRVPMFITHRKGIDLDGKNPTLLYGYGGFNISLTPRFSVANLAWLEMGGVYAVANLRGGGEYGREWHLAGTKLTKQNVFDDFIAAAQWLIDNEYTSTPKLAIMGGSNGGLLVGACMTQRPDLYGACLPAVGVMDMLRFHRFTIGWAWTSDYGSSDNADEFKALHAYSPLHNLRKGTRYPPTLITTADHDDRVVPAHSFKFAATLQNAHAGDAPVLIRIETKAGHGAGKPTSKRIEEAADKWAFLVKSLDMDVDFGGR